MAITNAQQYQQLVKKRADGERPGYVGSDYSEKGDKNKSGYQGGMRGTSGYQGGSYDSPSNSGDSGNFNPGPTPKSKPPITKDNFQKPNKFVTPTMMVLDFLGNKISGSKLAMLNNKMQRNNYLATLTPEEQVEALTDLAAIGIGTNNPMGIDMNIERATGNTGLFGTGIGGGQFITDNDLGGPEAKAVLGKGYADYQKEQQDRFTPDNDGGNQDPCRGPNPPAYCFTGLRSAEAATPEVVEEEDEIINYRLMADGGRAAFAGGGKDAGAGSNFGNENFGGNGDNNREQYGAVGQYKSPPPSSTGGDGPPTNVGGNQKTPVVINPIKNLSTHFTNNQKLKDAVALGLISNDEYNVLGGYDVKQTMGMGPVDSFLGSLAYNTVQSVKGDQPFGEIFGDAKRTAQGTTNISPELQTKYEDIMKMADGGRAGLAEGGMPYEGGIMDLESARQMYGLGKLVKKITRGVKKIAKSPIGKAAIVGGLGYLANSASGGAFSKFFKDSIFGKVTDLGISGANRSARTGGLLDFIKKNKMLTGLAGTTALSYFMTPEEEEEQKLYAGADIADPRYIMNNPELFTNRRLAAEGGSIDEPVAKKTMPLLDMDGQEMDLRAEGGFVPLGRMEKADDVPARLSKNEFVFTADAVRNAGEGDVDKGAEVMYNMMKNLESGGDVSEESQGLEGARDMFKTSQRLEEVL